MGELAFALQHTGSACHEVTCHESCPRAFRSTARRRLQFVWLVSSFTKQCLLGVWAGGLKNATRWVSAWRRLRRRLVTRMCSSIHLSSTSQPHPISRGTHAKPRAPAAEFESHTPLLAGVSARYVFISLCRIIDCEADGCAGVHGRWMAWEVQFIAELTRVCKPGGRILIVTWCHRVLEAGETALKADEAALLKDICSAYYLPAWCSIADYARIAESNGLTVRTQTSRESILSVDSTGYSSASMGWALWKPQANFSSTGFER